ncbi:MAG: SGNH/GDSL hydrolase family protein [Acidobacteria bacterium]|nr:SGNH/GDSL hydrolase family protein [Acidobacteriota bacterium]
MRRLLLLALPLAAAVAACGGGSSGASAPPTQPTPITPTITMTCVAPTPLRSTTGQAVPLQYTLPQVSGGTAPVGLRCSPALGTPVAIGLTSVTCTATDARSQTASCTFPVTVAIAPSLIVERFLAMGDSFTFGVTSRLPAREIPGGTFVSKLEYLLAERYPDQRFSLTNAGVPGLWMEEIEDRYPAGLRQSDAQVVILQGGANDLNAVGARAVNDVVMRFERMTRDAQGRGVAVILSTLTPHRPGSLRGSSSELVRETNVRIRDLCLRYRTGCADLYAAFGDEQSPLIGTDGLHPTPAGYDVIAETYFEVIRSMFERLPSS